MSPKTAEGAQIKPRSKRKTRVGLVTSDRMTKTIIIKVDRLVRHPLYHRVIKQTSSFKVHDEKSQAKIGDWVKVMETRPISKDKRWRIIEVIRQASSAPPVPEQESEIVGRARQQSIEAAKLAAQAEVSNEEKKAEVEELDESPAKEKGDE